MVMASEREVQLRQELDADIGRIRAALAGCPPVIEGVPECLAETATKVTEAVAALRGAQQTVQSMRALEGLCEETLLLATSAQTAFTMVEVALAILQADVDQAAA